MPSLKDDLTETQTDLRATANGAALDVSGYRTGLVQLVADLVGAPTTPTLDVSLQTSNDGINWFAMPTAWAFSQLTADGSAIKVIPEGTFGRYIRFVYTVGGSGYITLTKTWATVSIIATMQK